MGRWSEWLLVVIAGAMISAAGFAMAAEPLAPLGILEVSFWLTAAVSLLAGMLGTLVLIDLMRAFSAALGMAILAMGIYALAIWSPAVWMDQYSTHLLNYAMVQAIPVLIITVGLAAVGALVGTVINTSARDYDL